MNTTDVRKSTLELVYNKGYRYITRSITGTVHIHKELPKKKGLYWINKGDLALSLSFSDGLFEDVSFEDKQPLNIAEELGIID
ncbi:hypothetical protein [Veillonella montpellierensis]|uniref:hypothetical protein n=1 Tax=Veillonella montpellierensis TaxID=187328 RepID=UPI0023F77EBE|nr:hypothetical protein [Veillonella montpellierensis]